LSEVSSAMASGVFGCTPIQRGKLIGFAPASLAVGRPLKAISFLLIGMLLVLAMGVARLGIKPAPEEAVIPTRLT